MSVIEEEWVGFKNNMDELGMVLVLNDFFWCML
jgi:hypothetical protein